MPATLSPTYFVIDVPQLTEDIFEAPEEIRLVREQGDAVVPLENNEAETVLAALDQASLCRVQEASWPLSIRGTISQSGTLRSTRESYFFAQVEPCGSR